MKIQSIILSGLLLTSSQVMGTQEHATPKLPEAFTKLSSRLEGTWKGYNEQNPKEKKLKVEYEMTSGGSALVEKLFPGTDHEMVSIYHPENGKLAMTHYCAMGNQPHLNLKKSDENTYEFNFVPTAGINSKKDHYMGKLVITFVGPEEVKQAWTSYEGGKPKETTVFVFKKS